MPFSPCRRCFRHVNGDDSRCPFCGMTLAYPRQVIALGTVVALGISAIGCSSKGSTLLYAGPPGYESSQADAESDQDAVAEDAPAETSDASFDASSEATDALDDTTDATDEVQADGEETG